MTEKVHPALTEGRGAVITGGASGIGLAVAQRLSAMNLNLLIADRDEVALEKAKSVLPGGTTYAEVDVSQREDVERLRDLAVSSLDDIAFVMSNAGTGSGGGAYSRPEGWDRVLGVNLWGVIYGVQAFAPVLVEQGRPAVMVNTGSKQGITNPPGDAAYNVSKAGVRSLTESLAHELRNLEGCEVSAHLLVPGLTYTGMIAKHLPEQPDAAWTPDQVAEQLLVRMARGDFYIVCEDNDVTSRIDNARIQWNTDDLTQNRPALSRWHPDYADAFAQFCESYDAP